MTAELQQKDDVRNHIRPAQDRSVPWFDEKLSSVPDDARALLEKYSGIPHDEVESHVVKIRDALWEVHPFPCIGQFRFLDLNLSRRSCYPLILSRLLPDASALYLDIGCCVGQDLRRLLSDGVQPSQVYGAELRGDYVDLGYELFRDAATLPRDHFVTADVLDEGPGNGLERFEKEGGVDVLHLGMILHVFSTAEQKRVCVRAGTKLLRPKKGSLIVGQAVAHVDGPRAFETWPGKKNVRHNVESFKKLWSEIEQETGLKFDVRAELDLGLSIMDGKRLWDDEGSRRLIFEVERLD